MDDAAHHHQLSIASLLKLNTPIVLDDRSDSSGVGSLRSGSSDERSGSRSSTLSYTDIIDPTTTTMSNNQQPSAGSSSSYQIPLYPPGASIDPHHHHHFLNAAAAAAAWSKDKTSAAVPSSTRSGFHVPPGLLLTTSPASVPSSTAEEMYVQQHRMMMYERERQIREQKERERITQKQRAQSEVLEHFEKSLNAAKHKPSASSSSLATSSAWNFSMRPTITTASTSTRHNLYHQSSSGMRQLAPPPQQQQQQPTMIIIDDDSNGGTSSTARMKMPDSKSRKQTSYYTPNLSNHFQQQQQQQQRSYHHHQQQVQMAQQRASPKYYNHFPQQQQPKSVIVKNQNATEAVRAEMMSHFLNASTGAKPRQQPQQKYVSTNKTQPTTVTSAPKVKKVSSPAPPHIYGKPSIVTQSPQTKPPATTTGLLLPPPPPPPPKPPNVPPSPYHYNLSKIYTQPNLVLSSTSDDDVNNQVAPLDLGVNSKSEIKLEEQQQQQQQTPIVVSTPQTTTTIKHLKKAWLQRHSDDRTDDQEKVEINGFSSNNNNNNGANTTNNDEETNNNRKPIVNNKIKVKKTKSGNKSGRRDSDSSDSGSDASSRTSKSGQNSNSAIAASGVPRKRGRRPKNPPAVAHDEPRLKKSKDANALKRGVSLQKLKKTGESFLQDAACLEIAPRLPKCRECADVGEGGGGQPPSSGEGGTSNIFCRFYAFRRLRYTKAGQIASAGFSDPKKDASDDDLKLWLPDSPPADLDLDTSKFILKQVGDHFCNLLMQEERETNCNTDKPLAWKRVVQGVREMCDVCETTLFNYHWACARCGFVVCLDCRRARLAGAKKLLMMDGGRDRDDYGWLHCSATGAEHDHEKLMLTQIIAGDAMGTLGRIVHEVREVWGIEQRCGCELSKEIQSTVATRKEALRRHLEAKRLQDEKKVAVEQQQQSDLKWFADVALNNEKAVKPEVDVKVEDGDESNFSTLRELLIRPTSEDRTNSPPATANGKTTTSNLEVIDEVIANVLEDAKRKEDDEYVTDLKYYIPRAAAAALRSSRAGRRQLPTRIMTLTESRLMYPETQHSWLCDGKLLRLMEPQRHDVNTRIFQDQWKRGQPVLVSSVTSILSPDLWTPSAFARDFGGDRADLVDCYDGVIISDRPMRVFWEGFEDAGRRLRDANGRAALLKLKDWPPGEDFAELMPRRFADLMRALPLPAYTHRTGCLNLAGRLPECFVRPDLGPKMYNAYGSALHPSKGTTNLHLDVSDAVNVMVYVGITKEPDEEDAEKHIKEAYRAIDEAGCDILTRRRVRTGGELPGALWHIYAARDADKIRDLLNKVKIERGSVLKPHHDPIHDQSCYLDGPLRERLYKEYGVEGYAIVQCLGDAVFIPAGAPHQVRNLHNCIKVAEDFVSPENVAHCFHLTQEFRELSDAHTNREDKLQIKNIIYHAVKDAVSVLLAREKHFENVVESTPHDSSS